MQAAYSSNIDCRPYLPSLLPSPVVLLYLQKVKSIVSVLHSRLLMFGKVEFFRLFGLANPDRPGQCLKLPYFESVEELKKKKKKIKRNIRNPEQFKNFLGLRP